MGRYATRSLRGRLVSVATSLLIGGLALVGPSLAPSMADAGALMKRMQPSAYTSSHEAPNRDSRGVAAGRP